MQEVRMNDRFCTGVKHFAIEQIEGRGLKLLRPFLYLLSLLYFLGTRVHKALSFWRTKKLDFTSVCVGNIIAGGTGKTSFVLKLAKDLEHKFSLAIHSKGYLSKKRHLREAQSADDGDEAYLMQLKSPKAKVFVSASRLEAAIHAKNKAFDLMLFDDGLQNYELDYNLRIVLLNSDCLFGYSKFLPAGYLRESPKSLLKADYVVIQGEKGKDKLVQMGCKKVISARYAFDNPGEFKGKRVALFCGLGQSKKFIESVKGLAAEVVLEKKLVDHTSMSLLEFNNFELQAKKLGADLMICTRKDAVKMEDFNSQLPLVAADAQLEIVSGQDVYENLLDDIERLVKKNRKCL